MYEEGTRTFWSTVLSLQLSANPSADPDTSFPEAGNMKKGQILLLIIIILKSPIEIGRRFVYVFNINGHTTYVLSVESQIYNQLCLLVDRSVC
jgi:hypothetical protein